MVFCENIRNGFGYEVIEVVNGGMITGNVTFTGVPPQPRVFDVTKDPEICGKERSLVKVALNRGLLKGAVIVLEGVERGKPFESTVLRAMAPGEGAFHYRGGESLEMAIQLKNCNFGPYTGVVVAGQPLHVTNHDSTKHVFHTYKLKGRRATILKTLNTRNLPPHGTIDYVLQPKKLSHSHVMGLTCDRHDFMENWLYVVNSPYFAISDENGEYRITHVPAGQYDLIAWHPTLGWDTQSVHVDSGGQLVVDWKFPP